MRKFLNACLFLFLICTLSLLAEGQKIEVSFTTDIESSAVDGRLLVMFSKNSKQEPRFQIGEGLETQQIFGIDIENMMPGETMTIDGSVLGYPVESLDQIPTGDYWIQALIHKYETFHRADGFTVKLPMDRGEGQQWNRAPGNIYSAPRKIHFDPKQQKTIEIQIDKVIPPIPDSPETKYIKHIKIQSKLLSEFWGRPMYLGAHVLIPHGFNEHPEAKFPLMVFHGHFPYTFGGFRETPPDTTQAPVYSKRFGVDGYNITMEKHAYKFYKDWISDDFPRFVAIEIQHANPYYDDSYAVNSANLGPYGDAIVKELIPYIEKKFRCIGEGWARFLYGASTGGWEAPAAQIFYPDEFNGCFAACPDPAAFRAYMQCTNYEDKNAPFPLGQWNNSPKHGHRNWLGQISSTLKDASRYELVLGTHGRSGRQLDIWQAVFSPVGMDGYPKPIWNKITGEIDKSTAEYWRENYDLRYILKRDWKTLGPKLKGKLRIYCGDMDNYYLNNAVYLMEDFLESTSDPYYDGEVDYGDRAEHCWNGDHNLPNAISRLRYNQMYLPKILKRIKESAPEGADLTSWRY